MSPSPLRKFLDLRSPFFAPQGRRFAVVAICLIWALIELLSGAFFWALLFGAAGVYALYEFFIVFDPKNYEDPKE